MAALFSSATLASVLRLLDASILPITVVKVKKEAPHQPCLGALLMRHSGPT